MTTTTGHCLCGAIQFTYQGDPLEILHCHCESCRRHTASPVATFVMVPEAALQFTRGQPKVFNSSPGVRRFFCDTCGSPIAYRTDRRPDIVDLYAGTLSDPTSLVPQCHVYAEEQLPWFEIADHLPRYAKGSRATTPIRIGPRPSHD